MSGIMINQDLDTYYYSRHDYMDTINEESLRHHILQYKGLQVTDYIFCVGAGLSTIPNKTRTTYMDKYLREEENGQPVTYSKRGCETAHYIWNVLGLDPYQIWIDAARSIGIHPWFSFRMNDRHGHHLYPAPQLGFSDFFYAHAEEYARIHGRKTEFWKDRERDYMIPQVRQEMLDFMAEMLERYDLYGVELDFQRQFLCFSPGHEEKGREVMLGFVRDVRNILDDAGKKWGHRIKLSVRCHPNPITCYALGFDLLELAKQGLMDMFIAAPNFFSSDSDMPIGFLKALLEPYGVEIAGSMEAMVRSSPNSDAQYGTLDTYQSVESAMGIASYVLSQGADKFYLYNVFDHPDDLITQENKVEGDQLYIVGKCTSASGCYTLLSNAGSMETLHKRRRKCILSYTDTCAVGDVVKSVLPVTLTRQKSDGLPTYLKINTGELLPSEKVYLRIATADDVSKLEVYVNDKAARYVGSEEVGFPKGTPNPVHKFLVDPGAYSPCAQISELIYRGEGKLVIDYADMIVEP